MGKISVGIVMPTHFNIHSSLNNFLKTYDYLIRNKDVSVTLLTDAKNDVKSEGLLKNFTIKKIKGFDYNTILTKALFLLGIPRFFYFGLEKELQEFDVITANNPEFYAYAYQSYKVAKKHNKKFILRTSQTVEGFFLYKLTKFVVNPFVKGAYDYASTCVFTNPEAKERCVKLGLISSDKDSIITGHATDTDTFKPVKVDMPKKPMLLSVGGLLELKGHHLIIKAVKKIVDSGTDVHLNIVGEGYYRKDLEKLIFDLGLAKNVSLLGNQPHEELVKLYNQASVFVLANFQEITPAVNEALACETSVVVMECGGMEFVLPSEEYGLVSKKMDVDDMASKIQKLLKDSSLSKKIALKGKERVLSEFSIKTVAEKLHKSFT